MNIEVEEYRIDRVVPVLGEVTRSGLKSLAAIHSLESGSAIHSPSLGERIQDGKSILTLSGLIGKEETQYLSQLSQVAAASQERTKSKNCTLDQGMRVSVVRMPTMAAAEREICRGIDADGLPETLSIFLEEMLVRALLFVDEQLCPSVKETLFRNVDDSDHQDFSMVQLFRLNQLTYSRREPAVNVYISPKGQFNMHTDNEALTILIPLSEPSVDFTGGGTAFWSESCPIEKKHDPSLILKPMAGTAILFGGTVSHKGLPTITGTRLVFVASFSRLELRPKRVERRARPRR